MLPGSIDGAGAGSERWGRGVSFAVLATGAAARVDVAPPEAELRFCDYHIQYYHTTQQLRGLVGAYDSAVFPYTIIKTKDGYSFIAGFSDPNWEGLTNIMKNPELRAKFPTIFDRPVRIRTPWLKRR